VEKTGGFNGGRLVIPRERDVAFLAEDLDDGPSEGENAWHRREVTEAADAEAIMAEAAEKDLKIVKRAAKFFVRSTGDVLHKFLILTTGLRLNQANLESNPLNLT